MSGAGFLLLTQTEPKLGTGYRIHAVRVEEISVSLLLSLGRRAALQEELITEVKAACVYCYTQEEGKALSDLLEKSNRC